MNTLENLCYTWKLYDEYPVYKHTGPILPIPAGNYMRLNLPFTYTFACLLYLLRENQTTSIVNDC